MEKRTFLTATLATLLILSTACLYITPASAGWKIWKPPPKKLTIEKFNDTNNNGKYDLGIDVMINGWTIHVKYPDGVTAPYSTPVEIVITKYGTYTITEDMPADWIQTAVYVDDVPLTPPKLTVTVDIHPCETHKVLFGNSKTPPCLGKLIIQKFNDKNNNGTFDGTDVWLSSWNIDVTDPSGDKTTYTTVPIDLSITEFGTYTITEAIPAGWVQTALIINGAPQIVNPTATVTINPGDTYEVHYGNYKPPRPPIGVSLVIDPISRPVGGSIDFSWTITSPPEVTPKSVILRLTPPVGAPIDIYTGTTFPADFAKTITWIATLPKGTWWVDVIYTYEYLGVTYTAGTFGTFTVT